VVVCDLVMPDVDGFQVVAAITGDGRGADVPIIVYTNQDLSPADKARLNGHISGIVVKGPDAGAGLRAWLRRVASISSVADPPGQAGRASPDPA
jgi:CheY-like chemotaxis protein